MISVLGLGKRFGDRAVLDNVSFTARAHEIAVIVGPSGCGKTTMLRTIAGLERPDQGEITIAGQQVTGPRRHVAPRERGLGMVFQDLALWPHMRAIDQIVFGLARTSNEGGSVRTRAREVLARVAIEHLAARFPYELSGGECQRLAIARALAPGHRCLLMDEPFNSLDPLVREDMTALLKNLRVVLGATIVYVTHNFEEVCNLADHLYLMKAGRIVGGLGADELGNLTRRDLLAWYRETLSN